MHDSPVLSIGTVVVFHGQRVGQKTGALPLWDHGEAGIIVGYDRSLSSRQPSELGCYHVLNARAQVHILRLRRVVADDMPEYPQDDFGCSEFFMFNKLSEGGIPVIVSSSLSS